MSARPTRRDLLLSLLRGAGARGVTTSEVLAAGNIGSRYSARLLELRELGYTISSERLRQGQWRYVLVGEPSRSARSATAEDPGLPRPANRPTGQPANALSLFDGFEARPMSALDDSEARP